MKREGIVYGMPEDEYHGQGEFRGRFIDELSSTGAKLLLDAPARFKHVVIDGNRSEKKAWDIGAAVHSKVLGTGSDAIAYPDDKLSSNGSIIAKSKEWAEEQREAGLVPVKQHELDEINAVSEALLAHDTARVLLELDGHSEVSVFGTCPETGVKLRGRLDRLPAEFATGVDIKTVGKSGGASETEFAKQIFNFGYDIQAGQYTDTLKYATGREVDFAFIAVEMVAPYLVNVITITHTYMEMGRVKSMEARRRYKQGIESGEWPGYSPDIKRVEPPMFAVYDFNDNYEGDF